MRFILYSPLAIVNYKDIIKLLTLPFLVYMFNTTFESLAFNFYTSYSIDTFSHFLGGLTIAYSASYALSLLEKKNWIIIKKNILRASTIITTVITFAVLWEFYEFLSDYFLGTAMQPGIADTMKDLLMGMVGAIIFCAIYLCRNNKKNSLK